MRKKKGSKIQAHPYSMTIDLTLSIPSVAHNTIQVSRKRTMVSLKFLISFLIIGLDRLVVKYEIVNEREEQNDISD